MKTTIRKSISLLIVLSMAVFLNGCAYKRTMDDISSVNPSNEVIFVGRIEIDPKIEKDDVKVTFALGASDLYRTFVMRHGEDIGEMTQYVGDSEHSALVYTDEDFYLPFERNEPFKMFGGYFYTQLQGGGSVQSSTVFFQLKGGLEARYPKGAKAVYVGTIKFKRDEFYNLKNISVSQDGLEAAQKRFQTKFKSKYTLVKAQLVRVKPENVSKTTK